MEDERFHDGASLAPSSLVSALSTPRSGIVVGPPGSGKTVLAVELANNAVPQLRTELVVASEHLVGWLRPKVDPNVEVKTWRTWLSGTYAGVTGGRVPMTSRAGIRSIDWGAVIQGIEHAKPEIHRQLVIDEAQDVPRRLVLAMCRFSEYLLAFADPLQRHVDDGSSIEELVDALEHDHPWPVFVLEEDFRTTREIQRFATAAWAPERSSPSRSARNHGPDPRVVAGSFVDVAQEAARLLNAGGASVLVASDHADRASVFTALKAHEIPYNRGNRSDPARVSVLAYEALRGLEFDAVILVPPRGIQEKTWTNLRADLYVAATRARNELVVVTVGEPVGRLGASLNKATVATGTHGVKS